MRQEIKKFIRGVHTIAQAMGPHPADFHPKKLTETL